MRPDQKLFYVFADRVLGHITERYRDTFAESELEDLLLLIDVIYYLKAAT